LCANITKKNESVVRKAKGRERRTRDKGKSDLPFDVYFSFESVVCLPAGRQVVRKMQPLSSAFGISFLPSYAKSTQGRKENLIGGFVFWLWFPL
jgi:hypothetical protein